MIIYDIALQRITDEIRTLCLINCNIRHFLFYPAMTAFTDQYSLPNIFFDIGQL